MPSSPSNHPDANADRKYRLEVIKLRIELATLVAVIIYAGLTYCLLKTSRTTNVLVQQNFQRGHLPYVIPGKQHGSFGSIIKPNPQIGKEKAGFLLFFHNGGQGPALNFNVQLFDYDDTGTQQHMVRLISKDGKAEERIPGGIGLPAGSDRQIPFENRIPQSDLTAADNGRQQIILEGFFEYCDEFGGYSCANFLATYSPTIEALNLVVTGKCGYVYPEIPARSPLRVHPDDRLRFAPPVRNFRRA